MKNTTKKIGFSLIAAATLILAACGETKPADSKPAGSSNASTSSKAGNSKKPKKDLPLPKYDVTIKNADGSTLKNEKIELRKAIEKPADPTAPEGKVFYGWKNTKNGGQIWDFDEGHELNQVMDEVILEPLFVPASMAVQTFEAELCSEVTEANGGTGMNGATYSGGAKGKQMIYRDEDHIYGMTAVDAYSYYELYDSEEDVGDVDLITDVAETYETIDEDQVKRLVNANTKYGMGVHFNYEKGNVLSFELTSETAATDVSLFARFSAEYGKQISVQDTDEIGGYEDTIDSFSDDDFKIKVNGTKQDYGNIAIHNIKGTSGASIIYCQDYYIGNINLVAGKNTIELVVDNDKTLNGTIAASAPIVDSIKLFSSSSITWPTAKYTQMLK